ncbi:VOC family protein [Arthrobacter sp. CAU 1506]|uniref:VOC family protein n=1 Tax=Arthrobacter sp. CAU 1506 TaxID=2560052 RepID=UPI0010AC35EB|nr:VOC family protein [Arthrobacter sp. CAU 1506]TJY69426.1 VOC family protein [Arthrobacter sp. CAU 1506]
MALGMNPYLQFSGNAAEAVEFYHSVFGGELSKMTYAEGMGDQNPQTSSNIMHSSLYVDRGFQLMASDAPAEMPTSGNGTISLSSNGDDPADDDKLRSYWEGLSNGATVNLPLERAPWGDYFGQLTDRFGVSWMVNITAPQDGETQ